MEDAHEEYLRTVLQMQADGEDITYGEPIHDAGATSLDEMSPRRRRRLGRLAARVIAQDRAQVHIAFTSQLGPELTEHVLAFCYARRCEHQYIREFPGGPRDNGEYWGPCRLCGKVRE